MVTNQEMHMGIKDYAKETGQGAGMALQLVIWSGIVVIGLGAISYVGYSMFAPATEQVRYDTFKHSQSYNEGMLRDLYDLQREYIKANDDQKTALRALILHRFDSYDRKSLPADLQAFYSTLN
jgi:hypothetical protein